MLCNSGLYYSDRVRAYRNTRQAAEKNPSKAIKCYFRMSKAVKDYVDSDLFELGNFFLAC